VHRPWDVARARGSAGAFHARALPEVVSRSVEIFEVERSALVLGSTQPRRTVDDDAVAAAGIELVRRRSGGGAVLLVPGESLWVDVVLPRPDPLWEDDVVRSARWLGRAWADALRAVGIASEVHTGPAQRTRWSPLVCFAALGPGELSADGRKLVGVAQRRERAGARFQCVLHRVWDPAPLLGLLALDAARRAEAAAELSGVGAGVDRPWATVVDALLARLPG
jgi:lipoate-protein ligase A